MGGEAVKVAEGDAEEELEGGDQRDLMARL